MTDNQNLNIAAWVGKSGIVDLGPEIYGIKVWGPQTNARFQSTLLSWYRENKLNLPWRLDKNPYHVWVSEIMLQQTQVDTVIPYYQNFLRQFLTVSDLASASEERILKAWEGLGYYSRVKNMQIAAKQIMTDFNGIFPNAYLDILSLKGIGPYTAGAISSIAFDIPKPAVDGNAMRVYARLFGITADIAKASNRKIFEAIGEYIIAEEAPGDFNQAIMDLGRLIETAKQPQPLSSPVSQFTLATLTQTTADYPVKRRKQKVTHFNYDALIIKNKKGKLLISKRITEKLLNNLWTVPLSLNTDADSYEHLVKENEMAYQITPIIRKKPIGKIKHVFSHQVWHIQVYVAVLPVVQEEIFMQKVTETPGLEWVQLEDLSTFIFPTVQMKIWELYQEYRQNNE